ncbi:MAG: hypothetical protein WC708_00750 [Lentisphaeria bacterium]|jgi:hypothetical protein
MAKTPDDVNSGLGDISSILHNQGVSDLSWLNVDPEEYRKFEALPKQNLDIIPELQTALAWDGKDERVQSINPIRPHTTVNTNPLDTPEATLRSKSSVRDRLAEYVMEGKSEKEIAKNLLLQFSPEQLRSASTEASQVLGERGLLGNIYVDASHFPRCAQEGPHRDFVAKHAKRALYVLAKNSCPGCVCNQGGRCASFQKRVVREIPYAEALAAHYATQLSKERRLTEEDVKVLTSSNRTASDIKEHLRVAFLRPIAAVHPDGVQTIHYQKQVAAPIITDEDRRQFEMRQAAKASIERLPNPMYVVAARRMMKGHADRMSLSASSDVEIRNLAREHGILGHTYLDGDILGGIKETLDHIATMKSPPDFVVLRDLASLSGSHQLIELSKLSTIVPNRPVLTREHLASACERAVNEERMTGEQVTNILRNSSSTPDENIPSIISQVNLYTPPAEVREIEVNPAILATAHNGESHAETRAIMNPEEVRRTISSMMNSGLRGKKLQAAVLSRYSRSDLAQVPEVGSQLAAEDGIQGSYFIDPTAYSDYGRGCNIGSDLLRKKEVPNVFVGSSCTGCRLQTHPGWCSKYAKSLIRQIPDSVRVEAAERRRLPVAQELPPVEDPVRKYGLASELTLEPAPAPRKMVEINISSSKVTD